MPSVHIKEDKMRALERLLVKAIKEEGRAIKFGTVIDVVLAKGLSETEVKDVVASKSKN